LHFFNVGGAIQICVFFFFFFFFSFCAGLVLWF
jgi:hypothetical protein